MHYNAKQMSYSPSVTVYIIMLHVYTSTELILFGLAMVVTIGGRYCLKRVLWGLKRCIFTL